MPEALHFGGERMALWVLGGFIFVHVIQHGVTPHFHSCEDCQGHEGTAVTGVMALLGLSLHSFVDGMTITAAVQYYSALGILVFIGVFLHRIPEGATISSIFLLRGFGNRSALFAAGTLAASALLGALCQDVFGVPIGPVLAIAAGLSIYVACADLLPQAQKEKGWKGAASLAAGVLLFVGTDYALPHSHEHPAHEEDLGGHAHPSHPSPEPHSHDH
jgi:zinc transporter ZupT